MDMEYLKYKMKILGYSRDQMAKLIGISMTSFYKRLTGEVDWCAKEMKIVKDVLNLESEEFNKVFGF